MPKIKEKCPNFYVKLQSAKINEPSKSEPEPKQITTVTMQR